MPASQPASERESSGPGPMNQFSMKIHLPSLQSADVLPENVRFAEFRDPNARVAGFLLRIGRDKVLRLPTDTYIPCWRVDLVMENLWYLWAYGLMAICLYFAAQVLLP